MVQEREEAHHDSDARTTEGHRRSLRHRPLPGAVPHSAGHGGARRLPGGDHRGEHRHVAVVKGVLPADHAVAAKPVGAASAPGHTVDYAPFLFAFPRAERAYGPDVYVAAASAFRTEERYVDGEALSLVAELTSDSTRETDRTDKVSAYGRSGVPVYLLLDMEEQAATVFWRPSERGYDSRLTTPFGEPLHIPEPFGCDLDTSGFKTPAGEPDGAEGR
ncbi:Uma2 family endonuclease [Streptomyces mangrovi]|uniref:Uma2 family endonuclease n=1 Tax=Streptomyces mangrovi TaxID=1206892 RepID=UPI00399CE11C